jgi:NADH dehydrogenase/NADH:ubiquinone oxidoreductase subunit G
VRANRCDRCFERVEKIPPFIYGVTAMTEEQITLTIDQQSVTVPEGTTLLDAAHQIGKEIPIICYSDKTTANGLCRLCVVDVNNGRAFTGACVATCSADAHVQTPVTNGLSVAVEPSLKR